MGLLPTRAKPSGMGIGAQTIRVSRPGNSAMPCDDTFLSFEGQRQIFLPEQMSYGK
jgi:hypothetical protein